MAGDLTLIGKDVDLGAAQESSVGHSAQQSKSSGVSVGVTVNPLAAYKSAYQDSSRGNQSSSAIGKALRRGEAIGEGAMAATTAVVVQAGSRSASGSEDHASSGARVDTLRAGGDLTILADGGSIASAGAQMSAEGNALLAATDNIVFDVVHSRESQAQTSQSRGASFDNRSAVAAGVFNNKGNGKGDTDTVTSSTLSVGGKAGLSTAAGDIRLTASEVVAGGDLAINAARNLSVESGQNTVANDNHSDNKAIGKVVVSDTERFVGYNNIKHNDDA